jgi:hypothetical protein
VHRDRVRRHVALGVEVAVKRLAGWRVVDQLGGANLDDAMPKGSRPVVSVSMMISRIVVDRKSGLG